MVNFAIMSGPDSESFRTLDEIRDRINEPETITRLRTRQRWDYRLIYANGAITLGTLALDLIQSSGENQILLAGLIGSLGIGLVSAMRGRRARQQIASMIESERQVSYLHQHQYPDPKS